MSLFLPDARVPHCSNIGEGHSSVADRRSFIRTVWSVRSPALRREKDHATEADAGTGRGMEVIAVCSFSLPGLAARRALLISLRQAKWARVRCRLGFARGQP